MKTSELFRSTERGGIDHRRRLLCSAAAGIAAIGLLDRAHGQASANTASIRVPAVRPGTNTSFAPLKEVDAGVLRVAYAEAGPAGGPPTRAGRRASRRTARRPRRAPHAPGAVRRCCRVGTPGRP